MLARPKKKELSAEERQSITQASAKQTGSMSSPKTYDPAYPLFDTPVNQKVLIYIPNHTEINEDGVSSIRADLFTAHSCRMGKAYVDVRCCGEVINEKLGLDGSCPVCDATQNCWELFNKQWAELCKSKGYDPSSPEADEALKNDKKELLDARAVKKAEQYITFPIVVIDCEEGKTVPKKDAQGKITGTPMFYTIRTSTYEDKWMTAFDAMEDESEDGVDHNPAGRWAVLNFTYTPKSGSHNKRDSARNLKVTFRTMGDAVYREWEKYFDQMTIDWTPEVAQDVLVRNSLRDMDEMKEVADELLKPVREKLQMYLLTQGGATVPAVTGNANAEEALAGFGATAAETGVAPQGALPEAPVGEMPNAVQ